MSSMGFPTSPSNGDVYRKWQYDASTSSWKLHGVSGVTGDLGVLTINGQVFDPMADSDLSVTVTATGAPAPGTLGILTINGKSFDPALDSDLTVSTAPATGTLGILTINGKTFDPALDSDLAVSTAPATGSLGVLTIDGKAFDPAADSDLSITTTSATLDSADLGVLTINGKAWNPAADSDVSLTLSKVLTITYASTAPSANGVEIGDEYYVTSDGTSSGTVSAGYVWNGTTWTEQLTQVDGSASGSDF